ALRRPPLSFVAQRRRHPELLGQSLPPPLPLGVFVVQRRGGGGRGAVLREAAHHDQVLERAASDPQAVADAERFRPFLALALDLDLSGADGRRGARPRLEEARGPQPAIEPYPSWSRHARSSCKLHTGGRSCVYSVPTVPPTPVPQSRMLARMPTHQPDVLPDRRPSRAFRLETLTALSAGLIAACGTPGVRGVAGTAPAPNVFWTPPPARRADAPAPAQLPPDVAERVAQPKLADVIDIALRNHGSIGAAREALLAADWTHNATLQNVVLDVEQAYFDYLGTKALLGAQQTTLKEAQTNVEAAEQRHNVGLATIADVLQARTALSQA